jgi:acetyl esterase/lipase
MKTHPVCTVALAIAIPCTFTTVLAAQAPTEATSRTEVTFGNAIPLWNGGAPGFEDRKEETEKAESYWVKNIHNPSITAYLPDPDKATGAAVVICPGGGHRELVFNAEGVQAAEYLNSIGVAAFALKYRLGREEGSPYKIETHALQDGQRAIRLVRSRAMEWGIDPTRVGILGFSAGGEVVSMVSYADEAAGDAAAGDPIERESARPSFQMLVYPGPLGIPDTLPVDAPPAFLVVANDDFGAAAVVTSLLGKFRAAGVPVETHIYARGGHAFNMGDRSKLVTLQTWPQRAADWMKDNFILDVEGREAYLESLAQQRERMARFREMRRARESQSADAPE